MIIKASLILINGIIKPNQLTLLVQFNVIPQYWYTLKFLLGTNPMVKTNHPSKEVDNLYNLIMNKILKSYSIDCELFI